MSRRKPLPVCHSEERGISARNSVRFVISEEQKSAQETPPSLSFGGTRNLREKRTQQISKIVELLTEIPRSSE
jgi:hypothetical protein